MKRFHKTCCYFSQNPKRTASISPYNFNGKHFVHISLSLCKIPQVCFCALIPNCKGSVLLPSLIGLYILCQEEIEWFAISTANIFIRDYYLQYNNFLSLSDKESVIVSSVITVHALRKKGEIETVSFLTKLHSSLVS